MNTTIPLSPSITTRDAAGVSTASNAGAGSKARKITRIIPRDVAVRIGRRLAAVLGRSEGSSWSHNSRWHTESTWRYRVDDGSPWARIGHGPTRKMVTLTSVEGGTTSVLNIWIAAKGGAM